VGRDRVRASVARVANHIVDAARALRPSGRDRLAVGNAPRRRGFTNERDPPSRNRCARVAVAHSWERMPGALGAAPPPASRSVGHATLQNSTCLFSKSDGPAHARAPMGNMSSRRLPRARGRTLPTSGEAEGAELLPARDRTAVGCCAHLLVPSWRPVANTKTSSRLAGGW